MHKKILFKEKVEDYEPSKEETKTDQEDAILSKVNRRLLSTEKCRPRSPLLARAENFIWIQWSFFGVFYPRILKKFSICLKLFSGVIKVCI